MSFELAVNLDRDRSKTITLAGQEFIICPLPLRAKIALAGLLPKMRVAMAEVKTLMNSGTDTEADALAMFRPILAVPLIALRKAHPKITEDDLLDLSIEMDEIYAALPIIMAQAGAKPAIAEGTAAGETAAASPSKPSTGTDSSPTL